MPERFAAGANGASPATAEAAGDWAATRAARARRDLAEPVRLPAEGRLTASRLAMVAAAAGVVAILLGSWAFVSGIRDDGAGSAAEVAAPSAYQEALTLLTSPGVERLPLRGSVGRIVLAVRPSGAAALVLNGLGEAESGWAYQAWVSRPGAITRSAALFSGDETIVPLATPVPPGATLAVTLEPEAGSFAPTRTPKLFVERPL